MDEIGPAQSAEDELHTGSISDAELHKASVLETFGDSCMITALLRVGTVLALDELDN